MLSSYKNAWSDFYQILDSLLRSQEISAVLEIGGGARPFLTEEQVNQYGIRYVVIDSSFDELEKSKAAYFDPRVVDLSNETIEEKYDLIFSKMLLEHMEHPDEFHHNILKAMHHQSIVVHFYACRYSLHAIINKMLPSSWTDFIVYKLQGRNPEKQGKFKAYYKKCLGPTKKERRYFENLGYQISTFNGYLGHDYLKRIYILSIIERIYSNLLVRIGSSSLCSNAIIKLHLETKSTIT